MHDTEGKLTDGQEKHCVKTAKRADHILTLKTEHYHT